MASHNVSSVPTNEAFLEFLVYAGVISQKDREELLKVVPSSGSHLRDVMQSRGMVADAVFATFLAFYLRLPLADVSQVKLAPDAVRCVPKGIAKSECILPLERHESILRVAIDGIPGLIAIRKIAVESNLTLELVVATRNLRPLVERSYDGKEISKSEGY